MAVLTMHSMTSSLERRTPLLAMRGISKRFPGVSALADVSLDVHAGEVLALMGENGAGKSTLMRILAGVHTPDDGEITLEGVPVVFDGVSAAKRRGIVLIAQELMLAPNLDIASNIFLGNEQPRNLLGILSRRQAKQRAALLLARVGLRLRPTMPVAELTTGQQQLVELAKALSVDARIIVMDEPTSSLTLAESEQLFDIVRQLRAEGIAIIYISHRMEEVIALADRIAVMRDGRNAGELSRTEATREKIVSMMVGRELSGAYFPVKAPHQTDTVLQVRNLLVAGTPDGVTFEVRRGEILGFAGLVGSGRTELMQTLFGITPARAGSMTIAGRAFAPRSPREAIDSGVYLVPEDRKRHGLVLPMSVASNASLPTIGKRPSLTMLDRTQERELARAQVARLRIKASSLRQRVVTLSGGNQQKIVIAKWLAMSPQVLILDEPTRGIDVGAKAEIYRHICELSAQGISVLMVSSDMEELIGMSHRVVVMHERRLKGVLVGQEITQERVASLMTGQLGSEGSVA